MEKTNRVQIKYNSEYFSVKDTLECGQIFRFRPFEKGYLVFFEKSVAYCYNDGDYAVIECNVEDEKRLKNFFDLDRDYESIVRSATNSGYSVLNDSARLGKGIRILNQSSEEALFSFIISQNNNIPRIKNSIEKLCEIYGEKCDSEYGEYYSFPTAEKLALAEDLTLKSAGLGYRVGYIKSVAKEIVNGFNLEELKSLPTEELKKKLISLKGVGEKVADCVSLFGFHRSDSFPVDTWIEKVYRENFGGSLTDRKKITEYFVEKFQGNSGYFQQYLFYYKRSLEKQTKNTEK